jgi:hypothetical protein
VALAELARDCRSQAVLHWQMIYISGDLRLPKPIAGIMPGIIIVAGYRESDEVAMARAFCGTFACFSYAWLCKVGQLLQRTPSRYLYKTTS